MRCITLFLFCVLTAGAADQPLGLVEQVADGIVTVDFASGAKLTPGTVVAIYGPGSVQKHPLTKQVIVEDRKLLAKAQLVSVDSGKVRARIGWKQAGADVQSGMDVVPLPSEASPNSAPSMAGKPEAVSAPTQGALKIKLPIDDPDGDAMSFSWSIEGPVGQVGWLAARTTRQPDNVWISPGIAASATLIVAARDAFGHEFTAKVPVQSAAAPDEDWRKRECQTVVKAGGGAQKHSRLTRDANGAWWSLNDGKVRRISVSWSSVTALKIAENDLPEEAVAVIPFRKEIYVLDGANASVRVYDKEGIQSRRVLGMGTPTDLVIDADGTLFVADQDAGGVLVFEKDGSFRCRLGRAGDDKDMFGDLTRLALSFDGDLFALDSEKRRIQRFDRFQHRLETWQIQSDPKHSAVALAWHPRGLLALMSNGQILLYNANGIANESFPSLGESKLAERAGEPDSICVDVSGEIYVTYPESGYVARYNALGECTGVRGSSLWQLNKFAADGLGNVYGLDVADGLLCKFDCEGWLTMRMSGFKKRAGIAVSPDGQALTILDADKKNLYRYNTAKMAEKPLVFAQAGKNNGQLQEPIAIVMDESSRTYVLDAALHRVAVFDSQGKFEFNIGRYEKGKGNDELTRPMLLAVSPAGNAAYIYDYDKFEVKKFALDHQGQKAEHITNVGGKGDGPAQIRKLIGMGCDRAGLLYILDSGREDLQVIDFRGNNGVGLQKQKFSAIGVERPEFLALNPDGLAFVGKTGELVGIRW